MVLKSSHLNVAEQRPFGPHQCLKCSVIPLSFVSVRSFVLCSWPSSERGALNHDGGACFRVTCGLWELAWNLVGAKFMALKLFFSSLIDTCERLLIHKSEGSTNHFGSGFAIKCPSSLKWQRWLARACESEKALQEITVGWYLAPRRTGYLKQCFTGRLKHTKPLLSHLNRYLLTFLGIPNLEGKTWRGVSCGGSLKHIWSRVQSLLYRESMFLSHWQFSLFQVVLLSPATWL